MKNRWFLLACLAVILVSIALSFPLWTPRPSVNVSDRPPESASVPMVIEEAAVTVPADRGSETMLGDLSPLFSGTGSFEEAQKKYPDVHPVVTVFKSFLTDEQLQTFFAIPEVKRVLEILESPEYTAFITTEPATTREWDEFWAKHGIIQDPDRFQKEFREVFPTGEPEDFELEMRQTFADIFRDVDANDMMAIFNKAPQFLSDPRNRAWMNAYFDRKDRDFEAWAANILENLSANLREASSAEDAFLEDAILRQLPSPDRNVDVPSAADTHGASEVPTQQADEKMPVETASATPNSEPDAPDAIDINNLLTDDSLDALFAEDRLETLLKQRLNAKTFSTEDVQRALAVLDRYGPKEGLRRLRETDPEVASQIEGFLRQRQEN